MALKRYNFAPPYDPPWEEDSSTAYIDSINQRIKSYKNQKMDREVSEIEPAGLFSFCAFKMDPFRDRLIKMTEVREVGAPLTSAEELTEAREHFSKKGSVPAVWSAYINTGEHLPFLFEETSFVNLFSEQTMALLDIYRPPWKNYYTSDVVLYQWLIALGKHEDVQNLPDTFPETLYINHVSNILTKNKIKPVLDHSFSDVCTITPHSYDGWSALKNTPHLKCVYHILDSYNHIKAFHPHEAYEVKSMQVYRKKEIYNLKLTIDKTG